MRTTTLTLLEASHVMVSSALLALLGVAASRIQAAPTWPIVLNPFAMHNSYTFTTHTGFFKYDTVDGASLPAVAANFGLHENTSWAELLQTLLELNVQGLVTDGSSYKLVFAGVPIRPIHIISLIIIPITQACFWRQVTAAMLSKCSPSSATILQMRWRARSVG